MGIKETFEAIGITGKFVDSIVTAETIIGGIASVISIVGTATVVAEGIYNILKLREDGSEQLKTDLVALYNKFDQLFAEIKKVETEVLDASLLDTKQKIDALYAPSSCIDNARAYLNNPGDHLIEESFSASLTASQNVADELGDYESSLWKRVYCDQIAYFDWWSKLLEPPKPGWDYQYTLPAYLEAIIVRITVMQAASPGYRQELEKITYDKHAKILVEIYTQIIEGIVKIRPPNEIELLGACINKLGDPYIRLIDPTVVGNEWDPIARWIASGCICGAVERYSAQACTEKLGASQIPSLPLNLQIPQTNYTVSDLKMLLGSSRDMIDFDWYLRHCFDAFFEFFNEHPFIYRKFLIQHTIITRKKCEELYISLGLPNFEIPLDT